MYRHIMSRRSKYISVPQSDDSEDLGLSAYFSVRSPDPAIETICEQLYNSGDIKSLSNLIRANKRIHSLCQAYLDRIIKNKIRDLKKVHVGVAPNPPQQGKSKPYFYGTNALYLNVTDKWTTQYINQMMTHIAKEIIQQKRIIPLIILYTSMNMTNVHPFHLLYQRWRGHGYLIGANVTNLEEAKRILASVGGFTKFDELDTRTMNRTNKSLVYFDPTKDLILCRATQIHDGQKYWIGEGRLYDVGLIDTDTFLKIQGDEIKTEVDKSRGLWSYREIPMYTVCQSQK
jgi:hypothetical protein